MSKPDYYEEIASKCKQIRNEKGLNPPAMARALSLQRSSYYRIEKGTSVPSLLTSMIMASKLGVSLDWLFMDRGEMYYKEKPEPEERVSTNENETASHTEKHGAESFSDDLNELLDYVREIPLLKHEVLATFYRFKEDRPGLVEKVKSKRGTRDL